MDWWVTKQLRAMVLTDLRQVIPENYFETEKEVFHLNSDFENAEHLSEELRWGSLATRLGLTFIFQSRIDLSARQISAGDVLMNLGLLTSSEASLTLTCQLSSSCTTAGIADGNASVIAERLKNSDLLTLTNNLKGALKQYLKYLTPAEKEPFLSLLEVAPPNINSVSQPLNADALIYFQNLCAADFSSAWEELAQQQDDLEREQFGKGRNPASAGFASRVVTLYGAEFAKRSSFIICNLKRVHEDFNSPVSAEVESQLIQLGYEALSQQYHALSGAYERYFSRFGLAAALSRLDQKHPLHQAAIHNIVTQYFWTLRNVPMKSPIQKSGPISMTFHGPVGAVQTGSNSTANVQQFTPNSVLPLIEALRQLRSTIDFVDVHDPDGKKKLIARIEEAESELKRRTPNKDSVQTSLTAIAGVIQTLGSAQPAFEAVRSAGAAFGINF